MISYEDKKQLESFFADRLKIEQGTTLSRKRLWEEYLRWYREKAPEGECYNDRKFSIRFNQLYNPVSLQRSGGRHIMDLTLKETD